MKILNKIFRVFAQKTSEAVGSPFAFLLAFLTIIIWAISGPVFGFSETWQLVINTGTTIVTFLMIFLVQNAQNRDTKATQLKLDELIYAVVKAHNKVIDAERLSDEEIDKYKAKLGAISKKAVVSKIKGKKKKASN